MIGIGFDINSLNIFKEFIFRIVFKLSVKNTEMILGNSKGKKGVECF